MHHCKCKPLKNVPAGHKLCPRCRRLIDLGRAVEEMKPGQFLSRYADGWCVNTYPSSRFLKFDGKTPLEALRGEKGEG